MPPHRFERDAQHIRNATAGHVACERRRQRGAGEEFRSRGSASDEALRRAEHDYQKDLKLLRTHAERALKAKVHREQGVRHLVGREALGSLEAIGIDQERVRPGHNVFPSGSSATRLRASGQARMLSRT